MIGLFLATVINFDIIYIIFNLILLLVFYIAGINVYRGKPYWDNAWVCCITFILIVGSRLNRGIDYIHYVDVFTKDIDINQPYFNLFNSFLKNTLMIGKYAIFYIYAIPFIYGAFKLFQNYRNYSLYLFPSFLVCMQFFEEEFPRQAFSFSFVFFFINEFINNNHCKIRKWFLCLLYAFLTISMHTVNVIFIIAFLIIFFSSKRVFSYKLTIPILIFASYFFFNYYDITYVQPLLVLIGSTNPKFNHYIEGDAAEAWFGENALQLDNARNPIILLLEILANSSLFYFAYKEIRQKAGVNDIRIKALITITNLYIIGHITRNAFLYLELINRMASLFQRMWFMPYAFVIMNNKFNKLNFVEKLAYLSMIFLFYDYIKYLFAPRQGMTSFLWDLL